MAKGLLVHKPSQMCIWKSLHSSCLVKLLFEDKSQLLQIENYTGGHVRWDHWDSEKTYKDIWRFYYLTYSTTIIPPQLLFLSIINPGSFFHTSIANREEILHIMLRHFTLFINVVVHWHQWRINFVSDVNFHRNCGARIMRTPGNSVSHISMSTQEGAANKIDLTETTLFAEEDRVAYAGVYVFHLLP